MTGHNPTERAQDDAATYVAAIEERIEDLADEIGRLIVSGPTADREALHDYAVSLVREKLAVVDSPPAVHDTPTGVVTEGYASNAASLLGYGVLLRPIAARRAAPPGSAPTPRSPRRSPAARRVGS